MSFALPRYLYGFFFVIISVLFPFKSQAETSFSPGQQVSESSPPIVRVAASDRGIGLVGKTPQVSQTQMGTYWALLIGIDDYDHWPRLTTAVNDTRAIQETLASRYGFPQEKVKLLTNEDASREGILDAFDWLIKEAGENDNVLIYYAGHGELDKVTGYWVPIEAKTDKKGAYISNSTIRDYIGSMKAKHVYLVTDSCFSGSLFAGATRSKPPTITGRYFQEVYGRMSRQGMTSGGTEPVSDDGYEGHSIFAYYFLKTLHENNEPYMTASSLFDRIAVPVANNSKQTPISRPIRDVRDEGGEFIFALAGVANGMFEGGADGGGTSSGANEMPQNDQMASIPRKVGSLRAVILLTEKNMNVLQNESVVGNAISEKLGEKGFGVVSEATLGKKGVERIRREIQEGEGVTAAREDLKPHADTLVWGTVNTRAGATGVEGLVSCMADASVQVISVESGETLAQRNLSNVRGFGATLERACITALQNMGKEMSKEIVEKLRK